MRGDLTNGYSAIKKKTFTAVVVLPIKRVGGDQIFASRCHMANFMAGDGSEVLLPQCTWIDVRTCKPVASTLVEGANQCFCFPKEVEYFLDTLIQKIFY